MSAPAHHNHGWPLPLRLAALWLVYVTWSACSGWGLSLLGALHATGYALAALPLLVTFILVWKHSGGRRPHRPSAPAFPSTQALLPWAFLALLCLIAGCLHAPANYDALSYRLPRILYWWQEHRWHWIAGIDGRQNYSGTGFEWQMLPVLTAFRTDRLLFLLNWLPALLLPFLNRHALRFVGCNARSAALWMWPLALAYGLVLQWSSIGNDMQGAIFVVAALSFCRLARARSSFAALAMAGLAIAGLTALKGSNLPLILPLGVAGLLVLRRRPLLVRPLAAAVIALPLLLTSYLPTAVLNHHHSGHWSGDPDNSAKLQVTRPLAGLVGNSVNLTLGCLQPPMLPLSKDLKHRLIGGPDGPESLVHFVQDGFPRFKVDLGGEIPMEEYSGLGLGVTLLLLAHGLMRKQPGARPKPASWWLAASTTLAMTAFFLKLGSENTARILLPYYPMAIACLLAIIPRIPPARGLLAASHCWIPALFLLPALTLNPNRPLVPLRALAELPGLPAGISSRLKSIHSGYSDRNDPLAVLRRQLPANESVGFAGSPARSSYSLHKPFGSRRIIEVTSDNWNEFEWLIATPWGIESRTGLDWQTWLEQSGHEVLDHRELTFYTRAGSESWYLIGKRRP